MLTRSSRILKKNGQPDKAAVSVVQHRGAQMMKYLRVRARSHSLSIRARLKNLFPGPFGLFGTQKWQVLCEVETPLTLENGESIKRNLFSARVGYFDDSLVPAVIETFTMADRDFGRMGKIPGFRQNLRVSRSTNKTTILAKWNAF